MTQETQKTLTIDLEKEASSINLLEAKLLNLPLPEQYDPLLQQSGQKLHRLAQLCRLGLCRFK